MQLKTLPAEVAARLKWYVYRLVDPRNGETFYVGKGRKDRVLWHVKNTLKPNKEEDASDLKLQRIKEIRAAGLEVGHVIHRHGIEEENVAFQIEAAVMDAYPGLTNRISGHRAGDYAVRHIHEIVQEYKAQAFVAAEHLIIISIARSYENEDKNIYDAVRGCWRLNARKAKRFCLVLAHRRGLVLGAFRPKEWLPATKENFPWLDDDIPGRFGFIGEPAEPEVDRLYVGKRVPDEYRAKGVANPVRYIRIDAS